MSHLRAHDIVRSRATALIAEWTTAAAKLPGRPQESTPALVDAIPDFVACLADWLESQSEQDLERMDEQAGRHAFQRLERGCDLSVALAEHLILRDVIVKALRAERGLERPADAISRVDTAAHRAAERTAERYAREAGDWRRRYEAAALSCDQVLYDWDRTTDHILWAGPAREVLGYSLQEMGSSFAWFVELIHPQDRMRVREGFESPSADRVAFRVRAKGGRYLDVEARGRPITGPPGSTERRTGFLVDVSSRKEREREDRRELAQLRKRVAEAERTALDLRAAMAARDGFLAAASHELRTPLTTLILQADGLVRSLTEDEVSPQGWTRLLHRARKVRSQASRMDEEIEKLFDAFRQTGGGLELVMAPANLAELARDVVDRLRAGSRLAATTLTLRAEPVVAVCDRARLDQVFTQLIGNALKFGDAKPVQVLVENASDHARLVVKDRGIGVAPEDRERIFGRFERVDREEHAGGAGLGLWVVRELVSAMGGSVRVESEVGAGSSFIVELPRGE